jgi:hypothetical protein
MNKLVALTNALITQWPAGQGPQRLAPSTKGRLGQTAAHIPSVAVRSPRLRQSAPPRTRAGARTAAARPPPTQPPSPLSFSLPQLSVRNGGRFLWRGSSATRSNTFPSRSCASPSRYSASPALSVGGSRRPDLAPSRPPASPSGAGRAFWQAV